MMGTRGHMHWRFTARYCGKAETGTNLAQNCKVTTAENKLTACLESEHYIRQLSDIQIRCAPAQKIIVKGDGDVRRRKYVFLFM